MWIWLPDALEPVIPGRIEFDGGLYAFNDGRSYPERADAIPIYAPELPLQRGRFAPQAPLKWPGACGTVRLTHGRFAMIDNGMGFQLVPWEPALARRLGQEVSGLINHHGGVDWSFDRSRSIGL